MARNVASSPEAEPIYLRPWTVLLVGLGLVVVGLGLCWLDNHTASIVRAFCLVIGLFVAGAAIGRRLQTAGQELEQRLESAGMVATGAFAALLAYLAIKEADDWGSAQFFLAGVICFAGFGALLVLLPVVLRKVAVGLWLLFHFVGIFVACVNVAPPGLTSPPWVTEQAWTRVYRFYLGYLDMTNAYHFYSPDPAPSTLAWFRIQYEDDTARWVKMPDKKDTAVPLAYTRTTIIGSSMDLGSGQTTPLLLALRIQERKVAGRNFTPEPTKDGQKYKVVPIPIIAEDLDNWVNGLPIPPDSYKEPNEFSKALISSYVRYVAKNYKHETDPSVPVKSIKVYRLVHKLASPSELANGLDPMQEAFLAPYYLGTYDTQGKLLVPQQEYTYDPARGIVAKFDDRHFDGFVYWTVPILALPRRKPSDVNETYHLKADNFYTRNYLTLHAGDARWFDDDLLNSGGPVTRVEPSPKKEEGPR